MDGPIFRGRAVALGALHDAFAQGERVVTVLGAAGMGKTALARRFASWLQDIALSLEVREDRDTHQPRFVYERPERLTGAGGKISNGNELAKRAIEQGVAFVPGAPFYATNPDQSTLRLSFATADVGKIEEGVGRLGRAV